MSKLAKIMSLLGLAAFLAVSFVPPDAIAQRRGGGGARSGPATQGRVTSPGRDHSTRPGDRGRGGGRGDVRREVREERRDVRREVREWREDRWKRRLGVSLGVAAFRALTCAPTHVIIGNVYYYSCGVNWYRKTYVSSSVTYVVIAPPPGY